MKNIKHIYSLNFNKVPRSPKEIIYLIYHYTGMKSESRAVKRLLNKTSKVSCHYFIKKNGNIINMVPDKFIAFMGPLDNINKFDRRGNTPEDYLQVFKHFNVTRVIRLNEAKYDRQKFVNSGIDHTDLYFLDGSTPPDKIVDEFEKFIINDISQYEWFKKNKIKFEKFGLFFESGITDPNHEFIKILYVLF